MKSKLKASLIIFALLFPCGLYNEWAMSGRGALNIYSIAGGIGITFGFSLIPWLAVFLRKSPKAGYVTAAVIGLLMFWGASYEAKSRQAQQGIYGLLPQERR